MPVPSQQTGVMDLQSLLGSQAALQSPAAFGIDRLAAILAADLATHRRIVETEFLGDLVEFTTQRQGIGGVQTTGTMMEVDQYGRAPTQKQGTPGTLGFPMRLYQWPIGWTELAQQTATVRDFAIAQQGAERAHLRVLLREVKRSFFLSGNYSFVDRLVDGITLPVKRLANADGFAIPDGPNSESFDASTHQHYLAEAALSASGMQALVDTVVEHGVDGTVVVAINSANETAVKALTGFTAAQDPRLILATTATQARDRLDMMNPTDRLIGYFGAAEVWVKPWAIASYAVGYVRSATNKPLVIRQREQTTLQGLRIAATNSAFPLIAEFQQAEFGAAVQNRVKMAVYYFAGGTYTDPTL